MLKYVFPDSSINGERHTFENAVLVILFISSLRISILSYVFLGIAILYGIQSIPNAVKALLLLSFRTILQGSAFPGNLKLIMMAALAILIIIYGTGNIEILDSYKIRNVVVSLLFFAIIQSITALLFGSYPLVSVLKIFLFLLMFCALMVGIAATKEYVDWICYINNILSIIIIGSLAVIPLDFFRTVNSSFQGLFNHPNMLGIMLGIFSATILSDKKRTSKIKFIWVIFCLIMCFMSLSRTGMISILVSIIVTTFYSDQFNNKQRIFIIISLIVGFIVLYIFNYDALYDFIFKADSSNILSSREGQIDIFIEKFSASPIFGTGFMAPFVSGVQYWNVINITTEPGNIIFTLLGDCGIIGTFLFAIVCFEAWRAGNKSRIVLFLAPFTVSMGEMVFFSTNNMACILYAMIAVYMFSGNDEMILTP